VQLETPPEAVQVDATDGVDVDLQLFHLSSSSRPCSHHTVAKFLATSHVHYTRQRHPAFR
jgi:hypothetical protein